MSSDLSVATAQRRRSRGRRLGELGFSGVIALAGGFVLLDARRIVVPGSANTLGPRAFPFLVGALMLVAGAVVAAQALRGRLGEEEGGEDVDMAVRTDWRTVVILVGVFVAHILVINVAGWPVAGSLLFAGAAVTLGARPWWKAVLIAVALALAIQLVFGGMLGLSLPPGPLLRGVGLFHG
ncbi:tripartite tricarboxylate transporter TctB family protein [Xylanimonas ulmi]|uniref:Putative tricarboxylic transport membrane protein n=1 Tax=Xylanimonas ulmi TaxID=228973 RepID=A0A4Q7M5V9_9MICO|nr:tripartite tricarboxylate transporter TctB family protein [Xylanibacterium ulmi]RZS62387.1 putative tricarboxylic transport membrane protein [Xylanibacterium ulmi]